jgi:ATP-dependent Lon protease
VAHSGHRCLLEHDIECEADVRIAFGWATLPACTDLVSKHFPAAVNATILGANMAEHRIAAAKTAARWRPKEEEECRKEGSEEKLAEVEQAFVGLSSHPEQMLLPPAKAPSE